MQGFIYMVEYDHTTRLWTVTAMRDSVFLDDVAVENKFYISDSGISVFNRLMERVTSHRQPHEPFRVAMAPEAAEGGGDPETRSRIATALRNNG